MKKIFLVLFFMVFLVPSISQSTEQKKYLSPNGEYQAFVSALPGKQSNGSMVIIKNKDGKTIFSKSYGSEDREHGEIVIQAEWTPNSIFFVYSLESSGGHQPWHAPIYYFSVQDFKIHNLDDYIGAITNSKFELRPPDIIKAVGAHWIKDKGLGEESPFEVSLSKLVANKKKQ